MMQKVIIPSGWPCSLAEAPAGPFVTMEDPDLLCFKSEYHDNNRVRAFNSAGECFCCDDDSYQIQPVSMIDAEE